MADYQNIIDRVRSFAVGTDQTLSEPLRELATAYAEVCREANERLRRCIDYLRRGFRSEAVRLSESHPNLMEMVAALDIPEIDNWEQICATYELERPARMMMEAAQELNEAYEQDVAMQPLLRRHRLQALSRAPLNERLETIRQLAAADPSSSCWTEDQDALERIRIRELGTVAASVIRAKDLVRIDKLNAELNSPQWVAPIPIDLRESLAQAARSLYAKDATAQLREMVPEIRAALQSASYKRAKSVSERWQQIAKRYQLRPPDELNDEIVALQQWIAEQDRQREVQVSFESACTSLRQVLDAAVSDDILRQKYRIVQDHQLPIPDDIERDYASRLGKLERQQRFERLGIYFLIVVVAGAVIVGIILVARQHR